MGNIKENEVVFLQHASSEVENVVTSDVIGPKLNNKVQMEIANMSEEEITVPKGSTTGAWERVDEWQFNDIVRDFDLMEGCQENFSIAGVQKVDLPPEV